MMFFYPSSPITRANTLGFFVAASLHIFLISSVVFVFHAPTKHGTMEMTFLGAILDPFEVEKIPAEKFSARTTLAPIPLSNEHLREKGILITSLNKSALTPGIKRETKTTNKIRAAAETPIKTGPATRLPESQKSQPFPQYQRLKLPL